MPQRRMIHPQPLIAVKDVRASSRWYQQLLSADPLPEHEHRDLYDRIQSHGEILLQLHAWDAEDHPNLTGANADKPGHGVLLWFEVPNFDEIVSNARALSAEVVLDAHVNPRPQHRELWLRDPDGYVVVIASPDGEAIS